MLSLKLFTLVIRDKIEYLYWKDRGLLLTGAKSNDLNTYPQNHKRRFHKSYNIKRNDSFLSEILKFVFVTVKYLNNVFTLEKYDKMRSENCLYLKLSIKTRKWKKIGWAYYENMQRVTFKIKIFGITLVGHLRVIITPDSST